MTNPFSRTALYVLPVAALISVGIAIGLTVVGDPGKTQQSAGPDGYSRSAIGHHALITLLRRVEVPVVVSRGHSVDKAKHGALVIAEPRIGDGAQTSFKLKELATSTPRTLVVLPKWYGFAKPGAAFVDHVAPIPLEEVKDVLDALLEDAHVERGEAGRWESTGTLPTPALTSAQTIRHPALQPIIHDGDHILLGYYEHGDGELWILADPDALNNAGLRHPDNARFAVYLFDALREQGPVIFDETVHGHQQAESLFSVMFRFPLVLVTVQILLCVLLAMWAALVRFGPRRAPPPPIAPGKDFLIRNTATLLQFGGHHVEALRRYLTSTVHYVRHTLNAPHGLQHAALVAWLERVRLLRAGTISLPDLERAVHSEKLTPYRVLELANQIHRWRMEMMHGTASRS